MICVFCFHGEVLTRKWKQLSVVFRDPSDLSCEDVLYLLLNRGAFHAMLVYNKKAALEVMACLVKV